MFSIIFKNNKDEEFVLSYKVYNTNIANRWFDALKEQCNKDNNIYEKDRLYNFPNGDWDEEKIVDELNNCIQRINSNEIVIHHSAFVGIPQDQLNHLHYYFENLRGGVLSPTNFWNNSTQDIRSALERYNIIIHRAENFYHNKKSNVYYPRIVCTFANKKRYALDDEDYQYFTLLRKFGEVYINYCEVGKPIYDVFKDGDDIVGEDNIRPLRYYSSDFTAYFHNRGQDSVDQFLSEMDKWWNQNHNYLGSLGFFKDDPKNAIGNIPVAMLDSDLSPTSIINILCKFNIMDRIELEV